MSLLRRLKYPAIAITFLVLTAGTASAMGPSARAQAAKSATAVENSASPTDQTAAEHQKATETRLEAVKLKVCQRREATVNRIMARIVSRGEKQLTVFDKIAGRAETFYADKGYSLSTYDALVADVNAKRQAAVSALGSVQANHQFSCTAADPKGMASLFKASLKAEITALKNYRTAIKNLIVGVKSVTGKTSAGQASGGASSDQ